MEMDFIGIFNLENKETEGVVIRLRELKHITERLHIRFGLSLKEIAKRLKLNERSVRKLMDTELSEEKTEI